MKSTRGLPSMRLSQLPKERRIALGSLALLVTLLGSIVVYQRFAVPETMQPLPGPGTPRTAAGEPVNQAEAGTATPAATGEPEAAPAVSAPPQQLVVPLAGKPQVLQPYDFLYSEDFGDYRLHPGIDYVANPGESVLAAGNGTVTRIEDDLVEGRVVEIDHGNGLVTRYGGLGEVKVGLNAAVRAGTEIAQVGTGERIHLHFEVLVDGTPANPTPHLKP
ncbi:MAG: putative peptidase [Symbiobacteriaceae bacterium]|nr:putative peptidase [Symbiobacteriaceae bacterium]